jgi:DNA primase
VRGERNVRGEPSHFAGVVCVAHFHDYPFSLSRENYNQHLMFSDNSRERVRSASDIVDVIGSYVPLKKAGANFVALCPFHKEKSPSFNVNPHKQIFHCFGCHKGGDVFTFVMEFESLDFPEALRRLADRAKIPLEEERGAPDQPTRSLKESLFQIHEQIAKRWQIALANEASGQIARDYLAKRGVSQEAIELFRIGYAPDLWDDTVNWARSKDHDLATVEKGGLILKRDNADGYYDRFRGRLMFPICDEQGRVIGFSGRILTGDEKAAKYVNSPETPIFIKSKVFFGLHKSKRPILDAGYAIICEGQLDLIACFMAGVQNIVAPQGTAFTADHARILKRYVDEVVLCFDSDNAGQNAAVRSLDHMLATGLAVRVAAIPAPHDPDSFIKESGGGAFKALIEGAEGYFDYYLNRLCALNSVSTDKGRLTVLRSMAEAVHKTNNRVLIDKYAQKTALRLGVAPAAVWAEFRKAPPLRAAAERQEESAQVAAPAQRPNSDEIWLLKLLFAHEDLLDWAAAHVHPEWISHPAVREIVTSRLAAHTSQTWVSLGAFLETIAAPEQRQLMTEVAAGPETWPNAGQQLSDVSLTLRNAFLDKQSADLLVQLNDPATPEETRLELTISRKQLRLAKQQPLAQFGEA